MASRIHTDPEKAAELAAELRAWRDAGGSLYGLAEATGVARKTIAGWLTNGAPKGAVDFDRVMRVVRASRRRG